MDIQNHGLENVIRLKHVTTCVYICMYVYIYIYLFFGGGVQDDILLVISGGGK